MVGDESRERCRNPRQLLWVDAADYADTPSRPVDPAPLRRLLTSWSVPGGTWDEELLRAVADDAEDGPIHLVRLLAALESAARETGGSLSRVTDTPAVVGICGGALHHLVEVMNSSGPRAATATARRLGAESRRRAVTALAPQWQAALRALSVPLDDLRYRD